MNFVGTGTRLAQDDYARAAKRIGCDIAAIMATTQVEARGEGFDARRRPIILTEGHVLFRNLSGEKRDLAIVRGVAWPKWQPGKYPSTQDARYARLNEMIAIDEPAGLMAVSWGIGQVLGENYRLCGYKAPDDLVSACLAGEGGQLDVMVAFILGKGLGRALQRRDWATFAEGYNGSRYAENQYDIKLDRAYRKLSAGNSASYDPLADGLLSLGDKGDVVKALQLAIGVHADGDFGPISDQAVRAFQREHGLTVDGKVGKQTGLMLGLNFWN